MVNNGRPAQATVGAARYARVQAWDLACSNEETKADQKLAAPLRLGRRSSSFNGAWCRSSHANIDRANQEARKKTEGTGRILSSLGAREEGRRSEGMPDGIGY